MHRFVTWCHAPRVGRERGACPSRRLRPFFPHKRGFGCRGYGERSARVRAQRSTRVPGQRRWSRDGCSEPAEPLVVPPHRRMGDCAHVGEAAACRALLADDHLVHNRSRTVGRAAACALVRRVHVALRDLDHPPGRVGGGDTGRIRRDRRLIPVDTGSDRRGRTASRSRRGVSPRACRLGGRPLTGRPPAPRFRPLLRPSPCSLASRSARRCGARPSPP